MSRQVQHPVRRCAPCNENWPNTTAYNLCPRCQRNTHASTDDVIPNTTEAAATAKRCAKYRDFDKRCDEGTLQLVDADWIKEMNALLAQTPDIPDPSPPTTPGPFGKPYPFSSYDPDDA